MAGYKLATYQSADGPRAGLVIDDKVFDAAKLTKRHYATVLGILQDWRAARGLLSKAAEKPGKAVSQPLSRTKLLAPVLWPRRSIVRVRTTSTMLPR